MEIISNELKNKIENGEKVIVDFWAKWCGPCKVMKPTFDKISESVVKEGKSIQMYTMDVEENRDLAVNLGIRAVPTIKAFFLGKEVYSQTGIQTDSQLKQLVENVING